VYRLVGVVPGRTDIDVFWLGDFGSIEIAKIAMPDHVEAFVQKATLNDQSSFAVDHFLIDRLARRDCQIVRAEPCRREYHLSAAKALSGPTFVKCDTDSGK
jgi:hypothetical protein